MNIEPYVERQTSMVAVREVRGWQLKVYSICASGCVLDDATVEAAIRYASDNVPWPEEEAKFGFLTLHVGEEAVWLLVDAWMKDILRHFIFKAPVNSPASFGAGPTVGSMICVWELAVVIHERKAWINHVLSKPDQPDFEAYLTE